MEKFFLKIPGTVRISVCIRKSTSILDDQPVGFSKSFYPSRFRSEVLRLTPLRSLSFHVLFSTELHKFTKINDNGSDRMKNQTLRIAIKKINKTLKATKGKLSTHFGVISK